MALHQLTVLAAAESAGHGGGGGVNPWLVGVGTFVVLVALVVALVAFGGGREHS